MQPHVGLTKLDGKAHPRASLPSDLRSHFADDGLLERWEAEQMVGVG